MLIPRLFVGPFLMGLSLVPPYANWWILGRPVLFIFGLGFAAEDWEPLIDRLRGRRNPYVHYTMKDRWLDLMDRLRRR